MIQLRDYQENIISESRDHMRQGARRILLCSPTGSGKTAISTFIMSESAERGHTGFFLCHRVELLEQTEATFRKAGIDFGIIAAGRDYVPDKQVYICSIDTVRNRLSKIPTPGLLVIDEAVHTPAKSWRQVIDAYPDAWRIGLTATPQRLSGEGFSDIFDRLILGPSVRDLIDAGWLSDFRFFAPPGVDPTGLHTRAGDYIPAESALLVDKPAITGDVISHYNRLSAGKRAIVFCVSVQHSKNVAEGFEAAGIPARHVDGSTPPDERRKAMEDFRAGRVLVLTNCSLFIEGVDVPALETAILLRPTKSLALYLQMVGRALRPAEGKTALILDHVGAVQMHGFPDYPHKWTLAGREKRSRAANDNVPAIRVCEKCYAAYMPAQCCPYCGAATKLSPREIEQREGELTEIVRLEAIRESKREQGQARTLESLIHLGRQRGYRNPVYWARKVYSSRKSAS